jgi:hypothetical protein
MYTRTCTFMSTFMYGGQLLEPVGYQISWSRSQSGCLSVWTFSLLDSRQYSSLIMFTCTFMYIHNMTGVVYFVYVHYTSTAATSKDNALSGAVHPQKWIYKTCYHVSLCIIAL